MKGTRFRWRLLGLGLVAACDRPDMISADVWFDDPEPEAAVCGADLGVEVGIETSVDHPVQVAILAWWGDLDRTDDTLGGADDDSVEVLHIEDLGTGAQSVDVHGNLDWSSVESNEDGRVLLTADVGEFDGALVDGDRMEMEEYEAVVDPNDIYARATVSVLVCP